MNGKKPARPHLGGVKAAPTDTSAYAAPGEGRGGNNGRQPMGSRGKGAPGDGAWNLSCLSLAVRFHKAWRPSFPICEMGLIGAACPGSGCEL